MDDWENEDFDNIKLPAVKNQWDDEDVDSEEDIKESWDDSEDEKPKPAPKPAPKTNPKQKTTKLTKAQQRKAEEERKERERKEREELENETLEQRKFREAKLVQDADFQNTLDLFGADAITPKRVSAEDASDGEEDDTKEKKVYIEEMKPKTKEEFKKYGEAVYEEISRYDKNQFYNAMLETLIKKIAEPMEISNVRKLISALQLEITNKQKAQAKKKKTPKKATIKQAYDNDIISDSMKFNYNDG